MGFKHTSVPLHGLVALCIDWYHLLESHSLSFASLVCNRCIVHSTHLFVSCFLIVCGLQDSIIGSLNNELIQVCKLKSTNMPTNLITLVKVTSLLFYFYCP